MVSRQEESRATNTNVVTFILPSLPVSKNKLYAPEPRTIHNDRVTWGPTTAAKLWRSQMQRYVKLLTIAPTSSVRVDLWFFISRYTKDGRWRRVDVANYIDWTLDTIAAKQNWDDSMCGYLTCGWSNDPDNPRAAVRLIEVPNAIKIKVDGGELTIPKGR